MAGTQDSEKKKKQKATLKRRPVRKTRSSGSTKPSGSGPAKRRPTEQKKKEEGGFLSSLSCCSSKRPVEKKKPTSKQVGKRQPSLSLSGSRKNRGSSKNTVKKIKEAKKAKTKLPTKGKSNEPVESLKKNKVEEKRDHLDTAREIEETTKKQERSSEEETEQHPAQSLVVKKYVQDGRNVLRWEYEESVPLKAKKEETGLGRLLEQKPKKIEMKEEDNLRDKCCICCDCEGNKKNRR